MRAFAGTERGYRRMQVLYAIGPILLLGPIHLSRLGRPREKRPSISGALQQPLGVINAAKSLTLANVHN